MLPWTKPLHRRTTGGYWEIEAIRQKGWLGALFSPLSIPLPFSDFLSLDFMSKLGHKVLGLGSELKPGPLRWKEGGGGYSGGLSSLLLGSYFIN